MILLVPILCLTLRIALVMNEDTIIYNLDG